MAKSKSRLHKHVHYHRDGTVWARGQMTADGVMAGYWEWFRKDGTKMRSGCFENGEQAGEWTTYDRNGKVVKVTQMKAKGSAKSPVKTTAKKGTIKRDAQTKPAGRTPAKKKSAKK